MRAARRRRWARAWAAEWLLFRLLSRGMVVSFRHYVPRRNLAGDATRSQIMSLEVPGQLTVLVPRRTPSH
jgi:hypothetical protein